MSHTQITLFEHQSLKVGQKFSNVTFEEKHLSAFQRLYGNGDKPFFTLINNGIKFSEFVGVLQVGTLLIEVLPKADNMTYLENSVGQWRDRLIGMLKTVGSFDVRATSNSNLSLHVNSILDMYFEIFITEVEYLVRTGLIKIYRKIEGNNFALKGAIIFSKHIQKNLIHQERFYTRFSTFDTEHIWHIILYKAILLIRSLSNNPKLRSRIGALELLFPKMPNIIINQDTFSTLKYSRKTDSYRKVMEIARLLLLNYHPDVKQGSNNVLALMFNMNILWQKFVFISLSRRKEKNNTLYQIVDNFQTDFWKPSKGNPSYLKPDIVFKTEKGRTLVWDTKWKNLGTGNPSPDDLRQMYAYHEYCMADKVALIYPGENPPRKGKYYQPGVNQISDKECSIISIPVGKNIREFQENIWKAFDGWVQLET